MIKAVVFDMDGTLLNTLTDIVNSGNHALEQLGLPTHSEEKFKEFIGHGREYLVKSSMEEHYTEELWKKGVILQGDYYREHGDDFTKPYEGIVEMLEKLVASGIKCAVVSNKPEEFCKTLAPLHFKDCLDPVYGNIPGVPAKPDPYMIFKALGDLGVSPAETVYVGDSGLDMLAAKHSRVTGCAVSWGFQTQDKLVSNGADFLCHSAKELEDAILVNQNEYIYEAEGLRLCAVRGQDELTFVESMGKNTEEYFEEFSGTSLYAIKDGETLVCFTEINPMDVDEITMIFVDEEPEDEAFEKMQVLVEGFLATLGR